MTYDVSDLMAEIRIALDQNMSSTALADLADIDTLSLDELIESKIASAARIVEERAPRELLDGGVRFNTPDGQLHGRIALPSDFLRLLTFKMSSWRRAVTMAISEDSPLYMQQFSAYPGVRGSALKPVVAIVQDADGLVLEYFPHVSSDSVERAQYVPIPVINGGFIDICEKLKPAVVYYAAYLVALATGQTEQQIAGLLTVAKELARIS